MRQTHSQNHTSDPVSLLFSLQHNTFFSSGNYLIALKKKGFTQFFIKIKMNTQGTSTQYQTSTVYLFKLFSLFQLLLVKLLVKMTDCSKHLNEVQRQNFAQFKYKMSEDEVEWTASYLEVGLKKLKEAGI